MDKFWLKQKNIGRLHILLGRNDDIRNRFPGSLPFHRFSSRFERVAGMIAISIRINTIFLNIDWV